MVRRFPPFLAALGALLLLFVAAAPVAAYNNVNPYHLRLSRLDPLKCGTSIELQAVLTDNKGSAVGGKTVQFFLFDGRRGDKLAPASAVTDRHGKAFTFVTLKCQDYTRQVEILAAGPKDAKALITIVLHHDNGRYHPHGRFGAAGPLSVTTGSTGSGSAQIATVAIRPVAVSPVVSSGLALIALLPVGPVLLGVMFFLRAALRRRSSLRVPRLATA